MKSFLLIVLILIGLACSTHNINFTCDNSTEYTGLIKKQGLTNYQYGSHTLEVKDVLFAIKSNTINLDNYRGKVITVIAKPISGYPINAGPKYLEVIRVKQ